MLAIEVPARDDQSRLTELAGRALREWDWEPAPDPAAEVLPAERLPLAAATPARDGPRGGVGRLRGCGRGLSARRPRRSENWRAERRGRGLGAGAGSGCEGAAGRTASTGGRSTGSGWGPAAGLGACAVVAVACPPGGPETGCWLCCLILPADESTNTKTHKSLTILCGGNFCIVPF